jgi:protein-S-isoprenylcysteine O-methyltransferase Ste14
MKSIAENTEGSKKMNLFLRWSKKEYPLWQRLLAGLLAGGLFIVLIPWALLRGLPRLDDILGWPPMNLGMAGLVIGIALVVIGGPIGFWTVLDQYVRANGTPLPMLATQRLLTDGPYAWSRNPMVFGTLCAYLGLALIANSWSAFGGFLLFAIFLVTYVKLVEERELALRFGQAYLDYKHTTSFLVPWPRKHS